MPPTEHEGPVTGAAVELDADGLPVIDGNTEHWELAAAVQALVEEVRALKKATPAV